MAEVVKFLRVPGSDLSVPLPAKMTQNSAGWDVRLNLAKAERMQGKSLKPGEVGAFPTGLSLELPLGLECQIRSRSGMALNKSVFVLNSPGTIDADYRGEILVILSNIGAESFHLRHGDRIAQFVFANIPQVELIEADELSRTERGTQGIGSSGKN